MACYNFHCNSCRKEFELELSYSEYCASLYFHCSHCGSVDVRRTFTPTPIIFKDDDFTQYHKEDE